MYNWNCIVASCLAHVQTNFKCNYLLNMLDYPPQNDMYVQRILLSSNSKSFKQILLILRYNLRLNLHHCWYKKIHVYYFRLLYKYIKFGDVLNSVKHRKIDLLVKRLKRLRRYCYTKMYMCVRYWCSSM